MTDREVLSMALCGSMTHLTKWCVLSEANSSSGTILQNISELIPDPVNFYQLKNGVLLDVSPETIEELFPEDTDWKTRYMSDSSLNSLLYTVDMKILDFCCNCLKGDGLNSVLGKALKGQQNFEVYAFMVGLIINHNFCHYPEKVLTKLKQAVNSNAKLATLIQEFYNTTKKGNKKSSVLVTNMAKYLLSAGVFKLSEEVWTNLVNMLVFMGAELDVQACKNNKWSLQVRIEVVEHYISKMIDRGIFEAVYCCGKIFSFYVGYFLNNNNYHGEIDDIECPAYKLTITNAATVWLRIDTSATVYLRGLDDNEVAVLLKDITSFTAIEMLKEGRASDGSDCVVFQQILKYE